ncbi:coat protein [Nocardiopsis alba]|uniref:coat protein n=1 Tax=Nocardiopsis alba TaxID=53437 RepID=UPI0033BD3D52
MSLASFIPELWSQELLYHLDKTHVFGQPSIVSTQYTGEITSQGDAVTINQVGPVTIGDYTKNTDMTAPQQLSTTGQKLQITEAKYFNFQVDRVDQAQVAADVLPEGMARAAQGLADAADTFIANLISTGVHASNDLADIELGFGSEYDRTIYDALIKLATRLDEENVPAQGRWVVGRPAIVNRLAQDPRFAGTGSVLGDQVIRTGQVGEAAGFTVYKSNNSPVGHFLAGAPGAVAFAEQIPASTVEMYSPEARFADAVKGLHLYGGKVIQSKAVAKVEFVEPDNG